MNHKILHQRNFPEFPIDLFNWNGNEGSCEMSDLCNGQHLHPWAQIYSDASDVGFRVIGKTRAIMFGLSHCEIDRRENEIKWWELTSLNEPGFKLIIWND